MAFVLFYDRKPQTLTHRQALMLDKVRKGLVRGTPEQKAYAKGVRKIYWGKQHELEQKRELPPVPDWWLK